MGTEKDRDLIHGNVPQPQPTSLPRHDSIHTTEEAILYRVAKKFVKREGIDITKRMAGVVLKVQENAIPTLGGFRHLNNRITNSPQKTCLRLSIYTGVDSIGCPSNFLIPTTLDEAIMDSLIYEGADYMADSAIPNRGDVVEVLHRIGVGYDSPVGKYYRITQVGVIPPTDGKGKLKGLFRVDRTTAVPWSPGTVDPKKEYRVTSNTGMRIHPVTHKPLGHGGTDIAMPSGTPLHSPFSGKVVHIFGETPTSWKFNGHGIKVVGSSGDVRMIHMADKPSLSKGTQVTKGQLLGYSGNTGRSSGPHLHIELRINGGKVDPASLPGFLESVTKSKIKRKSRA